MAITRETLTDDTGAGTDGTIINAALLTAVYNSIETTWAADSYSPTWGNSGTSNTIGNGTLAGTYFKVGKLILFRILLTWGSTTSSGNGNWKFSFPAASAGLVADIGIGRATDTGTQTYFALGRALSSTEFDVVTLSSNAHVSVTATSPHTWANTDTFSIAGWYIAS